MHYACEGLHTACSKRRLGELCEQQSIGTEQLTIDAVALARFKPQGFGDYVVVGCYDTHPGRRRGPAGDLGLCRNASVVGPWFMPASDYPVHRGSFICLKRNAIRLCSSLASKERSPLRSSFPRRRNPIQGRLVSCPRNIRDIATGYQCTCGRFSANRGFQ